MPTRNAYVPLPPSPQTLSQAAKIRAAVQKRGVGEKSRVKVKLRDHTEVKGYISKIEDSSFNLTDKTRQVTTIQYSEVKKIGSAGLSKGAKIGIVLGVVAAAVDIVAVIVVVKLHASLFRGPCCGP